MTTEPTPGPRSAAEDSSASAAETLTAFPRLQGRLPHRYPFVLLDRILEAVPGEFARGRFQLSAGARLLAASEVLPLPFLVEACAQLTAVAASTGEESAEGGGGGLGYLAAIEGFHLQRLPRAGETVELTVRVDRRMGRLLQVICQVSVAKAGAEFGADFGAETIPTSELLGQGRLTVTTPG